MSTDQNKAALRRYIEGWTTRSVSVLDALVDEVIADEVVIHSNGKPGAAIDREGFKQLVRDVLKKMPDAQLSVEDMIAEGDKVVWRYVISATDASTGKTIRIHNIDILRFAGGKVAESWGLDVAVEPYM